MSAETFLSRGAFFISPLLSHNYIPDLAVKRQVLAVQPRSRKRARLDKVSATKSDCLGLGVFSFTSQPPKERHQEMPSKNRLTYSEEKLRNEMFVQGMLWCTRCLQFHPVKDFKKYNRADRSNFGYRYYCTRCTKAQHFARKEKQNQACNARNAALKAKFVELAGGKCQRCGYDTFYSALDFHHVYPALKKIIPTIVIYSGDFEKAWHELDKCCLLCRNCHTSYEARMWRAEFIKRPGLGYTIGADLPLDDKRYETDKPPKLQQAPLPLFTQRPAGAQQLGLL